jgi:hypothetical protein
MKLFEILNPHPTICYLTSRVSLPAGAVATRPHLMAMKNPGHQLAEALLERYRPEGVLPRSSSIPLAKRPEDLHAFDQKGTMVYCAVPLGTPQWSDFAWVLRIQVLIANASEERPSCEDEARLYWAGTECWQGETIWEGRVERVRILDARFVENGEG